MSRLLIEKTRRLLEAEVGTIYQPLEGRLRFALAFPGTYRLGMSALGFQIVYGLLNSIPGVTCERVFLPDEADIVELQRSHTRLFSMESQTPVTDFDILAFSISYELDYANVARILELSGLPVFASERDESHPLVIAGGPCATFNPEPVADLIDVFAIGDAEGLIEDVVEVVKESGNLDRKEMLGDLAQVSGIYVPSLYWPRYSDDGTVAAVDALPPAPKRVKRRVVHNLDDYRNLSVIVTPEAEFSNMLLTEAIRGCGRQCRFCMTGYASLPPRPRSIDNLPDGARVGLVGSAVFDHPGATAVCEKLTSEGRDFSVSSIRIESLTQRLADMMFGAGQRTLTVAPEAGTERLRKVLNKLITDEDVFSAADIAAQSGFPRLKLYFMVGLPSETDEDVDAIAELACEIARRHPSLRIQLSASCFVPKPGTPFQWCPMAPERELSTRFARLKKRLRGERQIELSAESPRGAHVQAWLARGDRRLGGVIAEAARNGMKYARAAADCGVDTSFYTERERSPDEIFPWDHIDLLVTKDYLRKEFTRAFSGQTTAECNVGLCHRCGVCTEQ